MFMRFSYPGLSMDCSIKHHMTSALQNCNKNVLFQKKIHSSALCHNSYKENKTYYENNFKELIIKKI